MTHQTCLLVHSMFHLDGFDVHDVFQDIFSSKPRETTFSTSAFHPQVVAKVVP